MINHSQPEFSSIEMMSSMRAVEMMISSKTGTPPPTSPVFPPWGHTANFLALQYFSTSLTSCVNFGRRRTWLAPEMESRRNQYSGKGKQNDSRDTTSSWHEMSSRESSIWKWRYMLLTQSHHTLHLTPNLQVGL